MRTNVNFCYLNVLKKTINKLCLLVLNAHTRQDFAGELVSY